MRQVEELVVALEKKYKFDIEHMIELYQVGLNREEMAEALGAHAWIIRTVASALNLRFAKKYRAHDYAYYLARFGDEANVELVEEVQELKEDLEQLSKDLVAKEVQLVKAKREVAKYRKSLKPNVQLSDFHEIVQESVKAIKAIKAMDVVGIVQSKSTIFKDHVQFIILSDLHFESLVSRDDVGGSNEYSWDIACSRLGRVFSEALNARRGEETIIVGFLGDLLDGLIHNSLETSGKPLAKAVADLAVILANYLISLSSMYKQVVVPALSGNHSRLTDYKRSNNQGFSFEYLMYQMIDGLVANHKNIALDISTCGFITHKLGEKNIGFFHGDYMRGSTSAVKILKTREAFKQVTGIAPNHIFSGHTHVPEMLMLGDNDQWIVNGSLIGTNAYSLTNGYLGTDWAQTIGSFLPSGKIENIRLVCGE